MREKIACVRERRKEKKRFSQGRASKNMRTTEKYLEEKNQRGLEKRVEVKGRESLMIKAIVAAHISMRQSSR